MDFDLPLGEFYEQIRAYVDWSDDEAAKVAQVGPLVAPTFPHLVDDFYETIQSYPFTSRIITGGPAQISRLKRTLHGWLESLFSGNYDQQFVESRWRVGRRHVEIGLHQAYALAALARLRMRINHTLLSLAKQGNAICDQAIVAVNKLLDIDSAIIDFAYFQANMEKLRQQAMVRVQQSERLAAIGQMVTGLAHESRNALQRSHACLEALRLFIDDRPQAIVQADRIQKALDRLHILYEEVRNYAAPIKLDCEPTDLQQMLKSAWHNLAARQGGIQVNWEFVDAGEPCQVLVDRHRIDQVLTNLLQNAVEACGEGGRVRCTVGYHHDSRSCYVCIEDNGPGIAPDMAKQVFEPFFTTKTKGTGLGLAISRRIIEAHGGSIEIDTSELGGAKFKMFVPCQPVASVDAVDGHV